MDMEKEKSIKIIVDTAIKSFATGFGERHIREVSNPKGTINLKKQNIFLNTLGEEFIFYSSLVRSFDSAFGNILEEIAIQIARLFYKVERKVEGYILPEQSNYIAQILELYKNKSKIPEIKDYENFYTVGRADSNAFLRSHISDYCLFDEINNTFYLIELKAGGDLDNKKALAEKQALLEQYFILKNSFEQKNIKPQIKILFATAYNKYGEGSLWVQPNVQSFFANNEIIIGKEFWNFVCKDEHGFDIVISQYIKSSLHIKQVLDKIRKNYYV